MSKEEKGLFHFVVVTKEDAERELQEKISNLTEDKKSDFKFKGEYFYEIGAGYDFVHSWFLKYVTKSGVQATDYERYWVIGGNDYELKDGVFVEMPKVEHKPIDWSEIKLPAVKNVKAKTIGKDLESVKPFGKYRK